MSKLIPPGVSLPMFIFQILACGAVSLICINNGSIFIQMALRIIPEIEIARFYICGVYPQSFQFPSRNGQLAGAYKFDSAAPVEEILAVAYKQMESKQGAAAVSLLKEAIEHHLKKSEFTAKDFCLLYIALAEGFLVQKDLKQAHHWIDAAKSIQSEIDQTELCFAAYYLASARLKCVMGDLKEADRNFALAESVWQLNLTEYRESFPNPILFQAPLASILLEHAALKRSQGATEAVRQLTVRADAMVNAIGRRTISTDVSSLTNVGITEQEKSAHAIAVFPIVPPNSVLKRLKTEQVDLAIFDRNPVENTVGRARCSPLGPAGKSFASIHSVDGRFAPLAIAYGRSSGSIYVSDYTSASKLQKFETPIDTSGYCIGGLCEVDADLFALGFTRGGACCLLRRQEHGWEIVRNIEAQGHLAPTGLAFDSDKKSFVTFHGIGDLRDLVRISLAGEVISRTKLQCRIPVTQGCRQIVASKFYVHVVDQDTSIPESSDGPRIWTISPATGEIVSAIGWNTTD